MEGAVTGKCQGREPITHVRMDQSRTQDDPTLRAQKVELVRSVAERVSEECGSLRVDVFGATATDGATIFPETDLTPDGNNDNTRDEARDEVVGPAIEAVEAALEAEPSLGSAPLGALAQGQRALASRSDEERPLELVLVTDGYESELFVLKELLRAGEDTADILSLAGDIEETPGASITVIGLGFVAGEPRSTGLLEGLLDVWNAVCHATQAEPCRVIDGFDEGAYR
ncbi:MAG: hypothetical protein M3273_00780 [Actinomycetota bacterium]|nr:hypothetical protein [Actinomycetota bacterium]